MGRVEKPPLDTRHSRVQKNGGTGQQVPSVGEITPEDYQEVDSIARALNPTWFTEAALQEIAYAVRHENGYVAVMDGVQVGFVTYRVNADDETAELTWIGVRPDFQRKGIGRRLVGAIEQELIGRGVKTLEVSTVAPTVNYEPYAQTRRFYHAIGFSDVRIEPKGFPRGDDKLLLRKQIGLQGRIDNEEDE
jgi:ribosomal protein S18 acetylase RimI-like enzyme